MRSWRPAPGPVDKLYEMARAAAVDGGDGKMDVEGGEDTWGSHRRRVRYL